MPRRSLVLRAFLASVLLAALVALPLAAQHDDGLRTASVGAPQASVVPSAPFLALAILGAMSGLVLLVALRPAR